ncbi:MAG: hypothetical protein AB1744_14325, partial [Candidatus Zixiibacteriota bacterium]
DLSPELRTAKTGRLYLDLLTALISKPQVIALDDFDRADELSRSVIDAAMEGIAALPLMFLLVSTNGRTDHASPGQSRPEVTVQPPSSDEWWDYIHSYLDDGKRENELFTHLLSASKGNPQYIHEFLKSLQDRGVLVEEPVSGRWQLTVAAGQVQVPRGLADIHLAIFDTLPETQRCILKIAAVCGETFAADAIEEVVSRYDDTSSRRVGAYPPSRLGGTGTLPLREIIKEGRYPIETQRQSAPSHGTVSDRLLSDVVGDDVHAQLQALVETGILSAYYEAAQYQFVQSSMREAVYDCLPESQARKLHGQLGRILEEQLGEACAEAVAYHFFRAQCWPEAFRYSLRAARAAMDANSLSESARYFAQCQAAFDQLSVVSGALTRHFGCCQVRVPDSTQTLMPDEVFEYFLEYGRFLIVEGQYQSAYRLFRRWRQYARK